jgi:hypothetical protein
MVKRAAILCATAALLSCGVDPTEVLVHVDADPISRARGRTLHVRVVSQEGETRLDRSASLFGHPAEVTLPTTVPVIPKGDDATRTFTVKAELVDQDDKAFNKKTAILGYSEHQIVDVDLYFSDLCIDIDCPEGQTCADGKCVDAHGNPGLHPGDNQPGACLGGYCWEHPRPTGDHSYGGACLWSADEGVVMVDGALVLSHGVWTQEPAYGGDKYAAACWSNQEVVTVGQPGVAVLRSQGVWSKVDIPTGPGFLWGVWGATPDDVWIVGDGGSVARSQNHGPFQKVDIGAGTNALRSVSGTAQNDVYFVGPQVAIHYDGKTFAPFTTPMSTQPGGIAAHTPNDLSLLAGYLIYDFDGVNWTQPFMSADGIASVATDKTGLFAAGGHRGQVFLRPPGGTWSLLPSALGGSHVSGLSVSAPAILAAGDGGAMARFDGKDWKDVSYIASSMSIQGGAADPSNPSHAIAVGTGGILERVAEGLWRQRVVGQGTKVVTPNLISAYATAGLFIAVGAAGAIAESADGKAWSQINSPTNADLHAVGGSGGNIYAAGALGALLHRGVDGVWTAVPGAPNSDCLAIDVDAQGAVYMGFSLGANATGPGQVYRYSNGTFTKLGADFVDAVTDLHLDSKGQAWVDAKAIYQWTGAKFVAYPTPGSSGYDQFTLAQDVPNWLATHDALFSRSADGTYGIIGAGALELAAWPSGRALAFGHGAGIRASN